MTQLISVEGFSHLKRDPNTNCIINTDQSALDAIIKRREAEQQHHNDIENLKTDMIEVKSMLSQLIGLMSNGTRNSS